MDDESWIDVVSIAHVKSLYRGYPLRIDDEVEIRGVVTANDSYGPIAIRWSFKMKQVESRSRREATNSIRSIPSVRRYGFDVRG